jgi:TPP-dependent trihydroxycyclohexane-1,2-dione (THcHDO) dehydratase
MGRATYARRAETTSDEVEAAFWLPLAIKAGPTLVAGGNVGYRQAQARRSHRAALEEAEVLAHEAHAEQEALALYERKGNQPLARRARARVTALQGVH